MTRICPECKAPLSDDALFCGSCGRSLALDGQVRFERTASTEKPFSLSLALPQAFRVARRSLVELRFRANEDVFSRVSFLLRCANQTIATACVDGRPGTDERRTLLQVSPQCPGRASVVLAIELTADGSTETDVYEAHFSISVDEAQTSVSTVNVAPHFTSDRAGHNEIGAINLNIAEGAIGPQSIDIARYEKLQRVETLQPCLQSSPSRLTLRGTDGQTIQLLSEDEITFGRNSENLIVMRVYDPDGTRSRSANEGNVSRFHFRIVHRNKEAFIIDSGSSYGTRLNGVDVNAAEGRRIGDEGSTVVGAGRSDVEFRYNVHIQSGGWAGTSGLTMKRLDGASEEVVVVWNGGVTCGNGKFRYENGRWTFSGEPGKAIDLGLFSRVSINGCLMLVMPFHHPYL